MSGLRLDARNLDGPKVADSAGATIGGALVGVLNLVHDVGPSVDVLDVPHAGGFGVLDNSADAGEGVGLHVVGPDGIVLVCLEVSSPMRRMSWPSMNATLSGLAML